MIRFSRTDLADETTIQTLLKNTAPNNTGFVVKKDVTQNDNIIGSVYSLVQLPQKYANTITTIQKRVGDAHAKEDVNGLIDQLIVYKKKLINTKLTSLSLVHLKALTNSNLR